MKSLITRFLREEEGATMVEYAIMVALIAVVAIAAVVVIGEETNTAFETVGTTLQDNAPEAPAAGGGG
ncbi:Flp/Fap pilin protein [Alcanivorax nanhaiticus]|uniref:Flp/Fap pilin protein n=1 Tax=Alcanivorax nanhaiticus TaxID=1177154 RepID=A0A095TQ61_9GAMM|nr:Flp family type IVb pilin [Alcanivorax nanhaiticus]KGD64518.1 Flp/Fap pilin protein [Alcanivorax nanhaiticus]